MCSVLNYLYSFSSYLYSVWSYLYSVSLFSLIFFIFSDILPIFSLILFAFSPILYIFSLILFVFNQILPNIFSLILFVFSQSVTIKLEELHSYNFIYFIGGTVKLHTDEIVNKSAVFRNTETSHYSCLKNERKFFKKENVAKIMTVAYLRGCVGCGRTPLRILSAIFRMLSALFCPLIRFKIRTL